MKVEQKPSTPAGYTPPAAIVLGTVRNDTYGENHTRYIEGKTTYRE